MRSRYWIALACFACAACATGRRHEEPLGAAGLPDAAVVAPSVASMVAAPSAAPAGRVPTILVIGDSHTYGAFGHRLHERLAAIGGHIVISEAAGGATTETYLEEKPQALVGYRVRESSRDERVPRALVDRPRSPMDSLDVLLARHEPEIVVVALGTNRPHAPVGESCDTFMQRLVHDAPRRRVFWIGPAAIGREGSVAVVASLRGCVQKVAGATFIDSTPFNASRPLPPDNPHFGPVDAARWADVVFDQIGPHITD